MVTRIVIIGGGPAGYEAALVAAGYGQDSTQVTVVDSDGIGGACVLYDCVPSKAFIASTGVRTELRRAEGLGYDIGIDDAKITLTQINNRAMTLAASQSADIGSQLLNQGITVIAGRAELVDDVTGMAHHRVKVTTPDGKVGVLKADVVLIATGASPRVLPNAVPDGERILTWRQLYDLTELPDHLVIVGSGVTGAEFCNAYTELGVTCTVVASRDQILPHEDSDAAAALEEVFAERGVTLVKNARADSVTRTDDRGAGEPGRRPDRRRQPRADERRFGAQHRRAGPGTGGHRAQTRRLHPGGPGVAHARRRASTQRATAPACSRWRRWRPCRAASRCTTRWARACRRSGCAPWRRRCSPGPRSPRWASRRPRSTTAACPPAR